MRVQVGMDARSLAARLPSRRCDGAAGQSEGRKGQTDRGAKNAQQRRVRAFRQSLVRAVVPSHQAFLDSLKQQQQQQQQEQEHQFQTAQLLPAVRSSPRTLRQTGKASGAKPGKTPEAEPAQPSQELQGQSQSAEAPIAYNTAASHTHSPTDEVLASSSEPSAGVMQLEWDVIAVCLLRITSAHHGCSVY